MKKIYTIQVTDCIGRPNIWYGDKIKRKYEAELKTRPGTTEAVFFVGMSHFIYPIDCKVVSERLVEIYKRG